MMKVFIDANVLIAVLNKEYPLFRTASRILSLSDYPPFELYTSATCLAISFYFAGKKCGDALALEKIRLLVKKIAVAPAGMEEVEAALLDKQVKDFEDGIEHYAAFHADCDAIVTEDINDFYFSKIPVMNCEQFLREVALPKLQAGRVSKKRPPEV